MSQGLNYENFPYYPPTPPTYYPSPPQVPTPHNPLSPPKVAPPPPPHIVAPPPPSVRPPPPHPHPVSPPPPPPPPHPHPVSPPPPPHVVPSPPHPISPPAPPPPPGHHPTVIIVVFVSLGGLFFLAFLAAALFCCVKKRKKRIVQEMDKFKIDEHVKVHEDIVPGPHGTQMVVLTIDEDVHIEEEIKKNVVEGTSTSHARSDNIIPHALEMAGSTSESNNHHLHHSAS